MQIRYREFVDELSNDTQNDEKNPLEPQMYMIPNQLAIISQYTSCKKTLNKHIFPSLAFSTTDKLLGITYYLAYSAVFTLWLRCRINNINKELN